MTKLNQSPLNYPRVVTMREALPEPFIDDVGGGVVYIGYAPLGIAENEEGWQIVRKTTVGGETKAEYPDGSMDFVFKWSERLNYTYSR